ncbi:Uu.00g046980.m01.CDS01 [Anthostomella pinea]|uniref:Uu.00g046980.m01.CDS01 n=1 Tax=Anthostomella pinea TaxID=933095 RepID=A0AAI8VBF7_9PEZI|nr:Uu.00g046980.m01.CDS01 [Anthostomella pinea]
MPTPIILCGKYEEMGKLLKEAISPDFEVVHFVDSPEAGLTDIPALLQGIAPTASASKLGTGNFAQVPRAIVLGATYDDVWVASLRQAITGGLRKVPLLMPDLSNAPAVGGVAPSPAKANQAAGVALRELKKLEVEGKLDGGYDDVFTYRI